MVDFLLNFCIFQEYLQTSLTMANHPQCLRELILLNPNYLAHYSSSKDYDDDNNDNDHALSWFCL